MANYGRLIHNFCERLGIERESLHGLAAAKGDPLAPRCQTCHGAHDIRKVRDRESAVSPYRFHQNTRARPGLDAATAASQSASSRRTQARSVSA